MNVKSSLIGLFRRGQKNYVTRFVTVTLFQYRNCTVIGLGSDLESGSCKNRISGHFYCLAKIQMFKLKRDYSGRAMSLLTNHAKAKTKTI